MSSTSAPVVPAFRRYLTPGKNSITVESAFNVPGWFFEVPYGPEGKPKTMAALYVSGVATATGFGWVVREVSFARRQYGRLSYTRRDAALSAVRAVGREREAGWPVPSGAVRVAERGAGFLVHVQCGHAERAGMAAFPDVAAAARELLDTRPGAAVALCELSPSRAVWSVPNSDIRHEGAVWQVDRSRNRQVSVHLMQDGGGWPIVPLASGELSFVV